MPAGRPSEYKAEFCDALIGHMKEGLSFESFGGEIGVSKQTLYNWTKDHNEFLDAKKVGETASQVFWERKGIDGLFSESSRCGDTSNSKAMNASIWIFNMKNRFGWRDKQREEYDDEAKARAGVMLKYSPHDEERKKQ